MAGQAAQPSGSDSPMTIGLPFSSGNEATTSKPAIDVLELGADAHLDVPVDDVRRSLGVERDEVERSADLARGVVRAAQAVLEEVAEERGRLGRPCAGDLRPAHPRRGQGALDGVGGVVVELVDTPRASLASRRCWARSRPPSTTVSTSARPYRVDTVSGPTGRPARPTCA